MKVEESYQQLVQRLASHAHLGAALRLLEWDQETYMPEGVSETRADQIGVLSSLLHERQTDPAFLDLVDELAVRQDKLTREQAVDVRETKWRLDRTRALPPKLVAERARLHAQARAVWIRARRDDDFPALAPYLDRIVELERMVGQSINPHVTAYDVLLEEYEPGLDTATVTQIFDDLSRGLQPLVDRLRDRLSRKPLDVSGLKGSFPVADQRRFNERVASALGFDFTKGRLDEAAHPFSTSIGPDVRITTRYSVEDLRYSLFSTIHETGHALYEQGLDPNLMGAPRGESCSLGIHESQSRLWENLVARSAAFWQHFLPIAQEHFPALNGRSLDQIVLSANEAGPSLIRTESDEITYNLHIILRFELERDLIEGSLSMMDVPELWRQRMRDKIGVLPATDREGVLQDVHWPSGSFGYFPTYTLGNIYAAQIFDVARNSLGSLESDIAHGHFAPLLSWLRENIHSQGMTYRAPELVRRATGKLPESGALLAHLQRKLDYLDLA